MCEALQRVLLPNHCELIIEFAQRKRNVHMIITFRAQKGLSQRQLTESEEEEEEEEEKIASFL